MITKAQYGLGCWTNYVFYTNGLFGYTIFNPNIVKKVDLTSYPQCETIGPTCLARWID